MFARGIVCTEYALTDNGKELRNAIIPLLKWASDRDGYNEKSKGCDQSKYTRVILDKAI